MTSMNAASVPWMTGIVAVVMIGVVAVDARAGAEVKLDRDFLSGLVEKLPPAPFQKAGQYHGSARNFRLVAIDPKGRRFIVACEVSGEFRPPVATALRIPDPPSTPVARNPDAQRPGWRSFAFDVRASVRVEPGVDGTPKFAVEVDEVKRRELDGAAGLLAKVLGKLFDDIVTKVADGKAATMSAKLNARVLKQVEAFKQYGVFCAIEYSPDDVVLRFDVTRLKSEGVAGYVFGTPEPGTTPLYRFVRPTVGDHFFTINPEAQGVPPVTSTRGLPVTCLPTLRLGACRWSSGESHAVASM